MKLSKRLQLIADVISKYKQGSVLADIGSESWLFAMLLS